MIGTASPTSTTVIAMATVFRIDGTAGRTIRVATDGWVMTDDTHRPGPPDSRRINVNQEYELRYWTSELNVSAERLREAVKAVGVSVEAVRKYLKSK